MKKAKKILENKKVRIIKVPATGDVIPNGGKKYHEEAANYAVKFNKRMLILAEKVLLK